MDPLSPQIQGWGKDQTSMSCARTRYFLATHLPTPTQSNCLWFIQIRGWRRQTYVPHNPAPRPLPPRQQSPHTIKIEFEAWTRLAWQRNIATDKKYRNSGVLLRFERSSWPVGLLRCAHALGRACNKNLAEAPKGRKAENKDHSIIGWDGFFPFNGGASRHFYSYLFCVRSSSWWLIFHLKYHLGVVILSCD